MKEYKVVFSPEAEEDLVNLYEQIAVAASPTVAFGYIERIEQFCSVLATVPLGGTSREDIRPGLRTISFERRATIAYRVIKTRVEILRIFYGGQNWEAKVQ